MELRRCLWRAPELLRLPHGVLHGRGTQKGDVYSFGILLYEIIGRAGPWGNTTLSDQGDSNPLDHSILKVTQFAKILDVQKFGHIRSLLFSF